MTYRTLKTMLGLLDDEMLNTDVTVYTQDLEVFMCSDMVYTRDLNIEDVLENQPIILVDTDQI